MLSRFLARIVTLLGATCLHAQQRPLSQNVDFRNFTYSFPVHKFLAVPGKMVWMSLNVKTTITLVNGRYDSDKVTPAQGPSIILDRVLYGYLTSAKQLDAVVVLGYHTGGTAWWSYVYAFSMASGQPKLVGWLRTGSRADFGLYRLDVSNGGLIVDLFDPDRRIADCCSEGFVRTSYSFSNGYFVQQGKPEFRTVEVTGPEKHEP
jgi:hypothetical protein